MGFCQGPLCVNAAYRSDYCDDCLKLRHQHEVSHELDGHSKQRITMCPPCETIQFQKKRMENLLD